MGVADRSESRGGATVRLLAVHSTEGNGTAQALRDADWWTGSSHAINDETGTLLTPAEGCVPYARASWTLRSGNHASENIEQVGWARYTRAQWLARPKLLEGTAQWLAARSKARGIPLVKLTPAQVAAGKSGVIGHVDWTVGMKDGSHTDPGPAYPWDVVLARAQQIAANVSAATPTGGFLMALNDAQQAELYNWMRATSDTVGSLNAYLNFMGEGDKVLREVYNFAAQSRDAAVQGVALVSGQAASKLSREDLIAAIGDAIPADIAEDVAKRLAAKLAA